MTKLLSRTRSDLRLLGKSLAMLGLLSSMLLLQGCPSRAEIDAEIWLNSGITPDVCAKYPELKQFGIYRKLDTGKYEFISYCTTVPDANGNQVNAVQQYLSVNAQKFNKFLDELLPKPQGQMR